MSFHDGLAHSTPSTLESQIERAVKGISQLPSSLLLELNRGDHGLDKQSLLEVNESLLEMSDILKD